MIFHKRVWAIVGILYVLLGNVLIFYAVFHQGRLLTGLTGVMLLPAIGGVLASLLVNRNKAEYAHLPQWQVSLMLFTFGFLFLLCLKLGIDQVTSLLGGAV